MFLFHRTRRKKRGQAQTRGGIDDLDTMDLEQPAQDKAYAEGPADGADSYDEPVYEDDAEDGAPWDDGEDSFPDRSTEDEGNGYDVQDDVHNGACDDDAGEEPPGPSFDRYDARNIRSRREEPKGRGEPRARTGPSDRRPVDEKTKYRAFTVACGIACVLGVAAIGFGTYSIVNGFSFGPEPGYALPDQTSQNVYYDAAGRTHVNVYITRGDDKQINIYVDQDGNVRFETDEDKPSQGGETKPGEGEATDPGGEATDPGGGTKPGEGDVPGSETTDPGGETKPGEGETTPGGEDETPGAGEQPGGEGTKPDEGTKPNPGDSVHQKVTSEQEKALLDAMRERIANGQSGFLESDAVYVVQRGDTLTYISNLTGFSVDFLAEYNHIKDKNLIITSESIRYPTFTEAGTP